MIPGGAVRAADGAAAAPGRLPHVIAARPRGQARHV